MHKYAEWNGTVFDPQVNEKNKVFFYFTRNISMFNPLLSYKNYKVFYLSLTLERMNKIDFLNDNKFELRGIFKLNFNFSPLILCLALWFDK